MSSSRHSVRLGAPLRDARVRTGRETFVSEARLRQQAEESHRAGFEAGQKALGEELVRQRAQVLEVQNTVLRAIERTLPSVIAHCEKAVVAVALEAARRVSFGLTVSAEMVEGAVRTGLAEIQDTAEFQVRLNPEDLNLLQSIQSPLLPSASAKITFIADALVPRAGCVIHTQHGAIEVNREKMFQKLEEAALC